MSGFTTWLTNLRRQNGSRPAVGIRLGGCGSDTSDGNCGGVPIPTQAPVPNDWRTLVKVALGQEALHDGKRHDPPPAPWSAGYDPLDSLDKAILRTEDGKIPN